MGIWLGPRGRAGLTEKDFTYSGNYIFTSDANGWELALLDGTNASLVFSKAPGAVDLFILAGGQPGGSSGGDAIGGKGGNGGERKTVFSQALAAGAYSVTVGTSGKDSSIATPGGTSYIAQTGLGSEGGRGSQSGYAGNLPAGTGDDGVLAFGGQDCLCFPGRKFGPGGGGGGSTSSNYAHHDGADGGDNGGAAGGGGGSNASWDGGNGTANTGGGGGGAGRGYKYSGSFSGSPGLGGSGIIILRSAR